MEKLLIPLGFIVLMSVLGYLTQMLKKAAEQRQVEKDRERGRDRREPLRTASSDIDRYLRAVDAQRQKGGGPAKPAPKPPEVPTVSKPRRPRPADAAAPAFPEARRKPAPPPPAAAALDDLPVAKVISEPSTAPVVTPPAQLVKPQRASAAPASSTAPAPTVFGRQFTALLKGPDSAALAIAMMEVLGPPKCKRAG